MVFNSVIVVENLMLKDEQIMMAVAQGDLKQLAILFDRYHVKLYNFFYKMNYNQALSEDLTQNVFERIIKYKHSFDNSSLFVAWMFRIARNVNADYYKKQKLKINKNIEVQEVDRVDDVPDSLEPQKRILKTAMSKLSDDYREVLLMTRYQGMQYSEVADVLQCTESNVKVRVHRAIKALRTEYKKLEIIS